VLLTSVRVGSKATIRRGILDKNVVVPDGVTIGVDLDEDRRRGFTVSDGGVVALSKGQVVSP